MNTALGAMLKRFLGGCALAVAALLPQAGQAAAPQDAIVGTWLTADGDSKADITATQAADGSTVYAGRVVWLEQSARDGKPVHDANNSDASLRARPILGLEILSGFEVAAAGGWSGGTMYSPRNGRSYPAELSLAPDGRLQIKVKAGFVSKTVYWTR
jgi:uncharacterized protein (DUF2147 family)